MPFSRISSGAARVFGRTFLLLFALVACSSKDEGPRKFGKPTERGPERVVATILFANESLTLVGLAAVPPNALPSPPKQQPLLAWQFEDDAGGVRESGEITVPLIVQAEFDETGAVAPADTTAGAAVFEVELPNVGSTFELWDPANQGSTQRGQRRWNFGRRQYQRVGGRCAAVEPHRLRCRTPAIRDHHGSRARSRAVQSRGRVLGWNL
jgi:hypothetical protein